MTCFRNTSLLLFSVAFSLPVVAAESASPKVNGVAIPAYRIEQALNAELARGIKDSPEVRKAVREILINQEVVAQAASKSGVEKRPATAAQLEIARAQILSNAFLSDYLAKNPISEDAVKKEYERIKARTPTTERRARHILVATEKEATDIIAQLKGGASFEKLAAEKSQDAGTKERDGELGWVTPDRVPKPFADAIAALAIGATTQTPVQTTFGYHVIRVEEERPTTIATYEQAKPQLEQLLQQQIAQKMIASLRAQAKVEE